MIIGYFGNVRQGKTLSAVKELYKLYNKGYKIYSNTPLEFSYTPLTQDFLLDIIEKDLDLPNNCVFFLDEIYMFGFDSRISGSKKNRVMSYLILQSGKASNNTINGQYADFGLLIIFTAQYFHQIDKRLRSVLDIGVVCRKHIIRGEKYFSQKVYVYKGEDSFNYTKVFKASTELYALYNTRKKITVQKDRYKDGVE